MSEPAPERTPPDDTTPVAEGSYEWYRRELERLRAELAEAQLTIDAHERHINDIYEIDRRAMQMTRDQRDEAKAERDHLRETLAESDLGSQVLALQETVAAADADRDRLEAELAEAQRVMAAKPGPKGIEELTEAIVEILGDPDETTVEAFLSFASAEVARIAGSEMVARWQAEDLLRIAHETSNRSEAERARAVAEWDALKEDLAEARAAAEAHMKRAGRLAASQYETQEQRDALKAAIRELLGQRAVLLAAIDGAREIAAKAGHDGDRITIALALPPMPLPPVIAALDAPEITRDAPTKPKHIGGRANAEDCPACSGTNPPYPWICPGEPEIPGDADRIADEKPAGLHAFEQNPAAIQISVCICGKWRDHHIHGADPCSCDACRTPGDAETEDRS